MLGIMPFFIVHLITVEREKENGMPPEVSLIPKEQSAPLGSSLTVRPLGLVPLTREIYNIQIAFTVALNNAT